MSEDKLRRLHEKERQLKAQIESIESRAKSEKRKKDTRIKILVGSVVLNTVETGGFPKDALLEMLNVGLTKVRDRKLFNLPTRGCEHNEV